MCGIGGIVRTDGQPIPEAWLDAIDARIAYRGPDGAGRFRDSVEFTDAKGEKLVIEVALIHRRLSIIDHASGAQPMVSERGRTEAEGLVAVVFNGCIYNHRELRRDLEANGHRFVTDHSDTEVLIHGWREWGEALPDHLEGMYAFAVWDRGRAQLFLARDVFGEKPLYFADNVWRMDNAWRGEEAPMLAFSSEIRALQGLMVSIRTDVNEHRFLIDLLKSGYTRVTQNDVDGTRELEQGSVFLGDCRGWFGLNATGNHRLDEDTSPPALPASRVHEPHPDGNASIESLIERAVARRLEADVPLGCFLSGGVDSSLIAHFAKRHKPDLMTFSVRMPDPRYDESAHAEAVARHIGTNHHTLDVAMKPAEDLIHLINILGQPFGDSSILPAYWVSKAARQHVKVALSGDGGDELFLGYERYMAAPFLARHWRWLRLLPVGFLHGAHPKSRWNKLARLADMARDFPTLGVMAMESIFTLEQLESLQPTMRAGSWACSADDDHDLMMGLGFMGVPRRLIPPNQAITELRDFDFEHYLPGDLLRKTDTASMACALEVRCPFLDRDLAHAMLAMPISQLIPGGERKGLLKQIARQHLPRECVDRPKMGFAIPIGEWFRDDNLPHRGAGMRTMLLDHLNSVEAFGPIQLNRKVVRRFIDEHLSGKRDHSHRLFTLLTLSIWARSAAT